MTDTAVSGLGPIGQIALTVSDRDRAVTFYRDALGMRHLFNAPPGLAFFDCGGIRLMLGVPEKSGPAPSGSAIYFRVADIDAMHASLVSRGVTFTNAPHLVAKMPDHELWLASFHDPDANVLALMEEKR